MTHGKNDGKPRLGSGGPGEQADPAAPVAPGGVMGSQGGRPAEQSGVAPAARGAPPRRVPAGTAGRATSEAERVAGPPDDRATTDWQHGEGEPRPETAPGAPAPTDEGEPR